MKKLFLILIVITLVVATAEAQSKKGWGNKTVGGLPSDNAKVNAPNQSVDDGPKDAGRDDKNGTTVHSDELYLTGRPSCLPSQGVWRRTGDRTFVATDEGFCFDPFGSPLFAPAGKIQFKSAITLNRQGNAFDGTMHIEAFDVNGVSVFTADAVLHGDRMRAEGP